MKKYAICPICKREFKQKKSSQKYCGKGCATTAEHIRNLNNRFKKTMTILGF